MQPIPIVYEEPHFLLVNKPAALFSQAPVGIDSLQARLIAQLKARDQHSGEPFIGLPHRLDRGTSGIMLIARNQRALKRFGQQFQSRKVIKHYLAVVEGVVTDALAAHRKGSVEASAEDQGRSIESPSDERWEDYVRKIPDVPQAEIVAAGTEGAKLAVARVERLRSVSEPAPGHSLLRIQLETGRMHQIRIQTASRGWPVVGDASYGSTLPWSHSHGPLLSAADAASQASSATSHIAQGSATESTLADTAEEAAAAAAAHGHPPIALHAWSLEFRHPQTAKALRFVAPVPDNWQQVPDELWQCIGELS